MRFDEKNLTSSGLDILRQGCPHQRQKSEPPVYLAYKKAAKSTYVVKMICVVELHTPLYRQTSSDMLTRHVIQQAERHM